MRATDINALCDTRGWSRAKLIQQLRTAARMQSTQLPNDDSLRRMIREWAAGRRGLSDFYASLMTTTFGVSFEAAASVATPTPAASTGLEDLASRLTMASRIDAPLVALLEEQTQSYRMLDRRLGATRLLIQAESHVEQISDLLTHSLPGPHRAALAAAGAEAAALAGWQALDLGDADKAWKLHEIAKAAAHESEDAAIIAHVTAQQAYVLLDLNQRTEALTVIQHAHHRANGDVPALLTSWLWAAEAEVLAADGQDHPARAALDHATRLLPTNPDKESLPYLALNEAHLTRWRGHCLARLGATEAVKELSAAVEQADHTFTRATAGLHCDLALAYSVRGEHDAARQSAQEANRLASQASSIRQQRRISRLLSSGAHQDR
jgi:tetratricopeptide (TPR) repeat protein